MGKSKYVHDILIIIAFMYIYVSKKLPSHVCLETTDIIVNELVNTDVVAHITPSSLSGMHKIGEGKTIMLVHIPNYNAF